MSNSYSLARNTQGPARHRSSKCQPDSRIRVPSVAAGDGLSLCEVPLHPVPSRSGSQKDGDEGRDGG